jgi:hypothetical protein
MVGMEYQHRLAEDDDQMTITVVTGMLQSGSSGRDTIRLLRNFDASLFQNHPSEDLRLEMQRLEQLNEMTKRDWFMQDQNQNV